MPKQLILPKNAFKDVRSLLRLDMEQLRALGALFATPESISPTSAGFVQKVAERLRLETTNAESIGLVCQFLLTVVEEGRPASEVLDDVREFVAQNAPAEEKDVVTSLDSKRKLLESLLPPVPEPSERATPMVEAGKTGEPAACLESPEHVELRRLSLLQEEQSAFNRACHDEELRELFDD